MRLTRKEIWDARTPAAKLKGTGAWTRKQLEAWGVPWPPPKGWLSKLVGEEGGPGDRNPRNDARAGGESVPLVIMGDAFDLQMVTKIYVSKEQLRSGLRIVNEQPTAEERFFALRELLLDLIATSHK